jgi:uncharacterized protein YkwD
MLPICKANLLAQRLKRVRFYRTFSIAWVRLWLVVVVVFISLIHPTEARETYLALANRLVAQAESENLVRPDLELEIVRLANSYRISKGLRALKIDISLQNAARAHAMDMMLNRFMGHVASTGQDFDSRMRALRGGGMLILPSMAENAARVSKPGVVDAKMAASLFQQWVKSAPHRKALLSRDFVKLAVGAVSKGGQLYADQIFTGPEVKTNLGQVGGGSIY